MEYVHLPLGEEIKARAGSYWISEGKIPYDGREILCLVRDTSSIISCGIDGNCGVQLEGFRSILIPGYLKSYRYKMNKDGLELSEVQPITDKDARRDITRIVEEIYYPQQVEFIGG